MPLVSVIVPFYNEEQHLEQCLNSLFRQSFRDFEVLLIDDQSTDGSHALAQRLIAGDSRFHLILNDGKGLFRARNKALSMAAGEFLCFVDSDDEACEDYLYDLVTCACDKMPDLVVQGYTHVVNGVSHQRKVLAEGFYNLCQEPQQAFTSFDINHLGNLFGKLYRRDIIQMNSLQFSPAVLMSEDQYFVLSYLYCCQTINLSCNVNYNYIIRQQSMSNSYWAFSTELSSYKDLNNAWQKLLRQFPCPALNDSYGVFVGNYINRLIFSHIKHPASKGRLHSQREILQNDCYPAFRRFFHPESLFMKLLKWTALHRMYFFYRLLMAIAIKRYSIVVHYA